MVYRSEPQLFPIDHNRKQPGTSQYAQIVWYANDGFVGPLRRIIPEELRQEDRWLQVLMEYARKRYAERLAMRRDKIADVRRSLGSLEHCASTT